MNIFREPLVSYSLFPFFNSLDRQSFRINTIIALQNVYVYDIPVNTIIGLQAAWKH